MGGLLKLSSAIDFALRWIARIGAWAGLIMVLVVVFDVVSRYFGVPKPFGLNSTKIQESEYWLHTILFSFVIGYAYINQSHIRIDLVRDRLPLRYKYLIEILGCAIFAIPFCLIALNYTISYAHASYLEHEVSKSVIGLTNIWILKSCLGVLFILLLLASISQLIKAMAGIMGQLPKDMVSETLGGDHKDGH